MSQNVLENVYHKGQEKIWNGRQVLADLVEKHGGSHGDAQVSRSEL